MILEKIGAAAMEIGNSYARFTTTLLYTYIEILELGKLKKLNFPSGANELTVKAYNGI